MENRTIETLTGVPETMLITVRARALESKKRRSQLKDTYAELIMKTVDSPHRKKKVSPGSRVGVIARTLIIDEQIALFISANPRGTVVNLGCGLDARFFRYPPFKVRWFDIDFPETGQIRRNFYPDLLENYTFIGSSILDFGWTNLIPRDQPILFIAEGVFMYFNELEMQAVTEMMSQQFAGSTLVFDGISRYLAKNSKIHPDLKNYNASFQWGFDSLADLSETIPCLAPISEQAILEYPIRRVPFIIHILRRVPMIRNSSKVIVARVKGKLA